MVPTAVEVAHRVVRARAAPARSHAAPAHGRRERSQTSHPPGTTRREASEPATPTSVNTTLAVSDAEQRNEAAAGRRSRAEVETVRRPARCERIASRATTERPVMGLD